jgi:hypothetical protein
LSSVGQKPLSSVGQQHLSSVGLYLLLGITLRGHISLNWDIG